MKRLALLFAFLVGGRVSGSAQTLEFTSVQALTNQEVRMVLSVPANQHYRLETSTDLLAWTALVTARAAAVNEHTDSAAPFRPTRYYRAVQLAETNGLTGDHFPTSDGDVIVRPVNHAGLLLGWKGLAIYNDPSDGSYANLPKADLVLISHGHGDHFNATTLNTVSRADTLVVAPQAVFNSLSAAVKARTTVLTNGAVTNLLGLRIEAVPAYNANHPRGAGNGYVVTIGGRRFYFSGDTGNTAEMRALTEIDAAFLCMNQPFTMTVNDATNAVRAFRPAVVYPYHYRDQNGSQANAALFKQRLGLEPGVEVRLRKWY